MIPFTGCTRTSTATGQSGSEPVWSSSRDAFDEMDEQFHEDGGLLGETNDSVGGTESGLLAWGESLVMQSYLLMYRAYRDTEYLDKFVTHADALLENRDSIRGVTDYRGRSLPAWRADSPYTIGRAVLDDEQGHPTLEVRSGATPGDHSVVTIGEGSITGTFTLSVRNWALDRTTHYEDLTMAPDSENYVVDMINNERYEDESPQSCIVTVNDLRDPLGEAGAPTSGEFELDSPHYIYAVHTGMITFPLISYVMLVDGNPDRFEGSVYREAADRYLEAVKRAVQIHDDQWRENERGEGYYVFTPGSPNRYESVDLPHNQSLALGRTLARLTTVTEVGEYSDEVRKLTRTFKNDLRTDDSDAYVWSHLWTKGDRAEGWSVDDPVSQYQRWAPGVDDPVDSIPEHIRYGHIETDFSKFVYYQEDLGNPLTRNDMQRLARTYTNNIAFEEDGYFAVRTNVNGTGPMTGGHEPMAATWLDLTPWAEEIFEHSRSLYDNKFDDFNLWVDKLFGVAKLNYWKRGF